MRSFATFPFRALTLLCAAGGFLFAQSQQRPNPLPAAKVTDARIQFFQTQLARDPDYYVNYNRLASAYVQKARETGDISYYELADKALKKSLALESQHAEAADTFAQLGGVQFAEHRFPEATASAQQALALDSNHTLAIALAGDAQLEIGNYSEAESLYARLTATDPSRPHPGLDYLSATRRASLAWVRGDVTQGVALMMDAASLARQARLPAENVAWTEFMLGDQLLQSGKLTESEAAMKRSLAAYPSYHRALAGMGKIRAAQHRFAEAANFTRQAQDVIPLPVYAAALGDLYQHMGRNAEAEKQYALVEYIGKLSAINQQVYNRELAVFYADHDRHLEQSLTLARRELELRHDVYTWDALAWALLKNGHVQEAREPMRKALALATRDPLLLFHAAALEHQSGNLQRCADFARQAVTLNPEFHLVYADEARQWLSSSTTAQSALNSYATH